ncbi:MAG: hypothetical protein ACE5IG_05100 [Dehalococcoidia bacterium]
MGRPVVSEGCVGYNSAMELVFERGNPREPKGHALAYFRVLAEQEKVLATYIVTLPITVDFSKYIPPVFAPHMGGVPFKEFSTFSMPPVPEEVAGYEELQRLAELRDDDIVFGGTLSSVDVPELIQVVNDLLQQYAQLWSEYAQAAAPAAAGEALAVDEVLYSLLSERDRLGELTKLVGKLRFAVEGRDERAVQEAEEEVRRLGNFLPERYRLDRLLQAVKEPSPKGARLAQLSIERCYKLCDEDYQGVLELERQLEGLESSG